MLYVHLPALRSNTMGLNGPLEITIHQYITHLIFCRVCHRRKFTAHWVELTHNSQQTTHRASLSPRCACMLSYSTPGKPIRVVKKRSQLVGTNAGTTRPTDPNTAMRRRRASKRARNFPGIRVPSVQCCWSVDAARSNRTDACACVSSPSRDRRVFCVARSRWWKIVSVVVVRVHTHLSGACDSVWCWIIVLCACVCPLIHTHTHKTEIPQHCAAGQQAVNRG